MRVLLALSFLLISNFTFKQNVQKFALESKEVCPNLGRLPTGQIPTWAVQKDREVEKHVVLLALSGERLIVPVRLLTHAEEEIHSQKDWLNFSKFYLAMCGREAPSFFKKSFSFDLSKKPYSPSFKNQFSSKIQGVGKVVYFTEQGTLLEGKVVYNSKDSFSSILLENGIFLVKNYKPSFISQNTLLNLNLKYIGEVYDSGSKLRIPVYRHLN